MRNEELILTNLVHNEEYSRKVLPFLSQEYFLEKSDKILYTLISKYFTKYNQIPDAQTISIILNNETGIGEYDFGKCQEFVTLLGQEYKTQNLDWLVNTTEKFCKDRAVLNAITTSVNIIDGNDRKYSVDHIPELLSNALAVNFDQYIGHDWLENAADRYDMYTEAQDRIPFDIDILNKITKGGMVGKALYLFLGGTGGSKTLSKCHIASSTIKQGYNVLYITLEMAEERISERIDANLLDVRLDDLPHMGKMQFLHEIGKVRKKGYGKLIVREYPARTVTASNIKYLIEELQVKKNFKPDLLIVDYLGLVASSTYKNTANVNSYAYNGAVAVELRALGQFFNIPVLSSVQTNRAGLSNSDPELENVADSHGISTVADFFLALYASEEMESMNQLMGKVLKNRFAAKEYYRRFLMGIDKGKMRLYNLDQPDMGSSVPDTRTNTFDNTGKPNFSNYDEWS